MSDNRFSELTTPELWQLFLLTKESKEPSDIQFAKDAVEEMKRRKPEESVYPTKATS